jgi:hypothetical protein
MGKIPNFNIMKSESTVKEKCEHLRLCVALSSPEIHHNLGGPENACMFYAFLFFFLFMARCLLIWSFSFSFIISLRQRHRNMNGICVLSPLVRPLSRLHKAFADGGKKQSDILKFNVK